MPGPNEVLHQWENEQHMLVCLATEELGPGHPAFVTTMADRAEFDGARTVSYEFSLVDGRGEPLTFPIKLVSRTTFDKAVLREIGTEVAYYVYENSSSRKARAHRGDCSHCLDGRGRTGRGPVTKNGRWSGPYLTAEVALNMAIGTGYKDAEGCGHCWP